jgi:choice-of-anchor B domain-containing protein
MKKLFIFCLLVAFNIQGFSQSLNMSLVGSYQSSWNNSRGSDVWGWVDGNGTEYALVGLRDRFSVINLSNPASPTEEFYIDESAYQSNWRDVKTFGNYAYITTEAYEGLLIVDLNDMTGNTFWRVSTFNHPNNGSSVYFLAARNLYIDENGIAYIFGASDPALPANDSTQPNGVIFLDVASNPTNPEYLGGWQDYYTNDGMVRGDTLWASCMGEGKFFGIDVSNKSNPIVMGQQSSPTGFTNNCWISDNGDYLFVSEEVTNGYITSYDVTDLSNIVEVDRVQSTPGIPSSPKNVIVDGNFLICSYYRDGTVVYDITFPNNMIEVGYYDSFTGVGSGYDGNWGIYPFLPSNLILATDINTNPTGNGKLNIYDRQFQQGCFVEGTVTDASNGNPLDGVNVEILTIQTTTSTNITGDYAIGTASSGTYNIVFSKPMYAPDTVSTNLSNGVILPLNVSLNPVPAFGVSGTVTNSSGTGISNAEVLIYNSNISQSVTTDVNGNFSISSVSGQHFYDDYYEVVVGKWSYRTSCNNQYISSATNNLSITLDDGYYDDFTFDFGWSVSGQATDGMWGVGDPEGTSSQGTNLNPEDDVNGDCYVNAYVTDPAAGNQAGSNDVDDGDAILTSPILDLSSYPTPHIHYYRWFANAYGNSPDDSLIVRITDGNSTVDVEVITANSPNLSSWQLNSFKVSDYLASTSSMQIIFYTADLQSGSNNYVEAGVDKFQVSNSIVPPVDVMDIEKQQFSIFPNPAKDKIVLKSKEMGKIEIYNLLGVKLLESRKYNLLKEMDISILPNGLYIIKLGQTTGKFFKN